MKLRKVIFWLHLGAGVVAGTVVLIMSITGVALMYQKQMTEWFDRSYWPAPPPIGAQPTSLETLIEKVRQSEPASPPSAVLIYSEPGSPAAVTANGRTLIVDRYSGEIAGEGSNRFGRSSAS